MSQDSSFKDGGWTFMRKGKRLWQIFRTVNDHAITMTGSNVSTQLHIPFAHVLLRLHLYHTDSSYSPSTDDLDVTLKRSVSTIGTITRFMDELWDEDDISDSARIEVFGGDAYMFEECVHTLILNTTDTDKVFPLFYVVMI